MPRHQPFCGGLCLAPSKLWVYSTLILLLCGFFKEFRPSDDFMTEYLLGTTDGRNLTSHEVNGLMNHYWTYSCLVSALFVAIFTDFLRYNPIILIQSLAYLSTHVFLVLRISVLSRIKLIQVASGIATATKVGYYAYIYSAVPLVYYQKITGLVWAVVLLAQSLSSFAAQSLYKSDWLSFSDLHYASIASICLAVVLALFLPLYFSCPRRQRELAGPFPDDPMSVGTVEDLSSETKREQHGSQHQSHINTESTSGVSTSRRYSFLYNALQDKWKDFRKLYTSPTLVKWSAWWIFGMCGMLQVESNVQFLWMKINGDNKIEDTDTLNRHLEWNNLAYGAMNLLATFTVLIPSLLNINWSIWGEIMIGCLSLVATIMLLIMSYSPIIIVAYVTCGIYMTTYFFIITIASAQIAIHVDHESYGLIFGTNSFVALSLQAVFFAIVNTWLQLDIRVQFVVYGCYYFLLTIIFVFVGVYKIGTNGVLQQCGLTSSRSESLCESNASERTSRAPFQLEEEKVPCPDMMQERTPLLAPP